MILWSGSARSRSRDSPPFPRFAYPQWSPAKNLLSYVVPTVPGEFLFETLDLSTGSSRRVALRGTGTWRHDVRLSPDGRFVAYTDGPTPNPQVTRTYLLRLADEKVIPITNGRWSERSPSFSADGRFLYLISNRGGAMDLWRQRLDRDGTPVDDPQPMTTGIGMRRAVYALCSRGGWNAAGKWIPVPYLDHRMVEELFRHRVLRLLENEHLLSDERIELLLSWRRSGFNIDDSVRIPAGERKTLEHVAR